MSSTLQQFAKVIDEVRENKNTPECCHNRFEHFAHLLWSHLLWLGLFLTSSVFLSLFLMLSSWVPVMPSCPPSSQMPWCFQSLSLKRETWRVGNTHTHTCTTRIIWTCHKSARRVRFWHICQISNRQEFCCWCSTYIIWPNVAAIRAFVRLPTDVGRSILARSQCSSSSERWGWSQGSVQASLPQSDRLDRKNYSFKH